MVIRNFELAGGVYGWISADSEALHRQVLTRESRWIAPYLVFFLYQPSTKLTSYLPLVVFTGGRRGRALPCGGRQLLRAHHRRVFFGKGGESLMDTYSLDHAISPEERVMSSANPR